MKFTPLADRANHCDAQSWFFVCNSRTLVLRGGAVAILYPPKHMSGKGEAVMNPAKTPGAKGEIARIVGLMRQSAEAPVRSHQITPPLQVLDPEYGKVKLLKIVFPYSVLPLNGFADPVKRCMETHIVERFGQAGVPAGGTSNVRETYHLILPNKGSANLGPRQDDPFRCGPAHIEAMRSWSSADVTNGFLASFHGAAKSC